MGWSFGWRTRRELTQELTRQYSRSLTLATASTKFGRNLWAVVETPDNGRFIVLYLIKKEGGVYGYKPIDETMGPVEVDCPLKLLDLAGETHSPGAQEWRKRVRLYHAQANIDYKPGDVVSIYGRDYTLVEKVKRSWIVRRHIDNRIFKSGPSRFTLRGTPA